MKTYKINGQLIVSNSWTGAFTFVYNKSNKRSNMNNLNNSNMTNLNNSNMTNLTFKQKAKLVRELCIRFGGDFTLDGYEVNAWHMWVLYPDMQRNGKDLPQILVREIELEIFILENQQ